VAGIPQQGNAVLLELLAEVINLTRPPSLTFVHFSSSWWWQSFHFNTEEMQDINLSKLGLCYDSRLVDFVENLQFVPTLECHFHLVKIPLDGPHTCRQIVRSNQDKIEFGTPTHRVENGMSVRAHPEGNSFSRTQFLDMGVVQFK
jgi:hypothetical protein